MRTPFQRFVIIATVASLPFLAHAQSQDNRYGSWAPPGAEGAQQNGDVTALLKELNTLIKDAEKSRAADRMFLRDLKDLTARYDNPWSKRLLYDNFADGNYQRDPAWSVTSGEYFVEQGYGLRARVTATAASSQNNGGGKLSKEQMAISILGAIMQGGNKNGGAKTAPQPTAQVAKPSSIETRARISNAFAATVELSSWKAAGTFAVAMNQGLGGSGYRVEYTAGKKPTLELVRVTSRGRGVIDGKSIATLEDKKVHSLSWTRTKDGTMTVSIDGKAHLTARDASFRDPFDSVALTSKGSDVIIKSVTVLGMR